jgi:hypothetical protein
MTFVKRFCRLLTEQDLDDEQVVTFFDIVQSVVPAKLITAYTDDSAETVSVEVIAYTQGDQNIYEILLEQDLDAADGDVIVEELHKEFDFDFDFEASMEI